MSNATVLFVTHKPKQCGVYEFGSTILKAIAASEMYRFVKAECESLDELHEAVKKYRPIAVIYNYHPSVLPWVCTKVFKGCYKNHVATLKPINIGIIHEVTQEIADTATGYRNTFILGDSFKKLNSLFDFYVAADPTLLLKNPIVFKTGRLIPGYAGTALESEEITVGSFGFATPKKGFEKVVQKVQEELDRATIRFNIPAADFGDEDGSHARALVERCKTLIKKPGIKLLVSHEYLDNEQLLHFLARNSINVFMYEDTNGRGISSAVDLALAVKKPLAVSRCSMFRHLLNAQPSICLEDRSLKDIIDTGYAPLKRFAEAWDSNNMRWEYERIMDRILALSMEQPKAQAGLIKKAANLVRKTLTLPDKQFSWLRTTDNATEDDMSPVASTHNPITLKGDSQFNRILDDNARALYQPAIKKLFELAPKTMAKKITRANVQQGFVFDTVYRILPQFQSPKVLCVGSYEDTASMALIRMGVPVEEIDPMINYYLQEFYTKPTTVKNSYHIIFSTSVIEHDPEDASFLKCIAGLLAPGGIAVITCDYKDGWLPGQPKPEVDARFYTKRDLEERLQSYVPDCQLTDTPHWDCPNPDFNYLGKYQYTFATFTFQKRLSA